MIIDSCVDLGQECQANGTEYTPIGRRKKKQQTANGDDDDQYEDLSDDEIIVEDEDEDDLSDLYPGSFKQKIFSFVFILFPNR